MEIRFAQAKDVSGILALLRQAGRIHHQERPDLFRANAQKYGASQVLNMLNDSDTPIFVAVENDKVLGYGFCSIKKYQYDPIYTDHSTLFVDDLCVDENHRRQHIGSSLYWEIHRYAKARRCSGITLNTWCCNDGACKFFESLNMRPQTVRMEAKIEE